METLETTKQKQQYEKQHIKISIYQTRRHRHSFGTARRLRNGSSACIAHAFRTAPKPGEAENASYRSETVCTGGARKPARGRIPADLASTAGRVCRRLFPLATQAHLRLYAGPLRKADVSGRWAGLSAFPEE